MTAVKPAIKKRPLRSVKLVINFLLLLVSIVVAVQNAHVIEISFLWWKFDISLTVLIFLTGSIGSVITILFNLLKGK